MEPWMRTTIGGLCLPDCWYPTTCSRIASGRVIACPGQLRFMGSPSYEIHHIALSLGGRPITGGTCGGADPYVTDQGESTLDVDIWRAYADGIWTSSVDIRVYAAGYGNYGGTVDARVSFDRLANLPPPCAYQYRFTSQLADVPCPTTLVVTATVYDSGTFLFS